MKASLAFPSFWPLLLQPSLSFAYWRMACSVSQTARVDLILNPGSVSGHVHKFAGGSNVNENSDFDSLQTSNCSTCEVQADKSAYWTPQLYYAHANGTFEEVPNYGMTVYYVGRGGNASNTVPFPPGFKMLTGDSRQRSYDNTTLTYLNTRPVADRVSFHCINDANDIPEQHYMFDTDCSNGMRAQVNFQSCWDGVNLYLDNNAHVDYLSGIDYGVCPPSHPVSIPGLFFEVLYWTNLVDQSGGGEFVFSNGDTTGYGFHGDFLNAWDMDVQTGAVQDCLYTDNGGVVDACSYLAPPVDDVNFPRDCLEQPSVFDEPVHGLIDALPGCNPITSGPDLAPQVVCPLDTHTSNNLISNSTSTSAPSSITTTSASTTSAISSIDILSTNSTTDSSQTFLTPTLIEPSPTLPTTSETSTSSTTSEAISQFDLATTFPLSTTSTSATSTAVNAFLGSSPTTFSFSPNNGPQQTRATEFPSDPSFGGIFVTVPSDRSMDSDTAYPAGGQWYPASSITQWVTTTWTVESGNMTSSTGQPLLPTRNTFPTSEEQPFYANTTTSAPTQQLLYPSTTFLTITSAIPTNFSDDVQSLTSTSISTPLDSASTTLDPSIEFACSLYKEFTIEGCPPPTITTSLTFSTTADVATPSLLATQLINEEFTSTTASSFTTSATTATTTLFRIRGREVIVTAR